MVLCALMTMSLSAVCAAEETAASEAEPQVTVASTTQAQPNQTVADWLGTGLPGDWYNTKGRFSPDCRRRRHQRFCRYRYRRLHRTAILVKGGLPFVNRPGIGSCHWIDGA